MLVLGMVVLGVGCIGVYMASEIQQLTARVAQLEWQLATRCRTCHPTVPQFPPSADACADVDLIPKER
jgi:hypothetical protein